MPLKKIFSHIKKSIKLIKISYRFLCEIFLINIFLLVNCILNDNILIELDKRLKLNKIEIYKK